MSVHESEDDKITAAFTLRSCCFFGEISHPTYLSSHKKDAVSILAVAITK